METKEKVLATMQSAGEPLNAGKIAELSGLDRKEVDKVRQIFHSLPEQVLMVLPWSVQFSQLMILKKNAVCFDNYQKK